jgi:hypothetical protein
VAAMADLSDLEDRLAGQALALIGDMREDLGAAHRTVRALDHLELQQLCCVLAAMVPMDMPLAQLAWWRLDAVPQVPAVGPELQPCGTPAAYQRHTDRGEKPCDPCVEAMRLVWAERKREKRRAS